MSKVSIAKVESSVLGRMLKASLLVCVLVCATSLPPEGRADALHLSAEAGVGAATAAASEGGVIAFSSGGEIYVMGAGGGTATRVVGLEGGGTNRHPAVSPDGTRIAFSSSREGEFSIYIVGVDGEGLQRLTQSYYSDGEPAWSPDGSKIAFVRGYDGTAEGYANLSTCAGQIYVIDVPSPLSVGVMMGGEVSLTRGLGGTDPAWSPDGTRIAFSSYREDNNYELYTMDANGDGVTRLTFTGLNEAEPAWSPDGISIAYASYLVRAEEGCGWMGIPLAPGASVPGVEAPGIYVMTLGRNRRWRVSGGGGVTDPTWSPDGTSVAFVSVVSGDGQLYTAEAASGLTTQLTFDSTPKSSPSWSHSGNSE